MRSCLTRRGLKQLVLLFLLGPLGPLGWLGSGLAQAHKASDAYMSRQVDSATVTQRFDIALRDLDRDLGLDDNGDGQLTWGEVRRHWADIERLADQGLRLLADGQACQGREIAPAQLDEHSDGRYAVLQRRWECAAPVQQLTVDYHLFASSDPTHRGIARITTNTSTDTETSSDQAAHSALLVPGAGEQRFELGNGHSTRGFLGFVAEGLHHIAIGLDHILFLVTLLMVAVWRREGAGWAPLAQASTAWREALRLVTAFTLAHSLTLGLAASGVLAPPSRWVESLIAISVLLAALDNLRPFWRGPRWVMVSLFGLVHGFGFAGPLQDLGLRQGALALPLLGFNLGVELGQLALVMVLLPLAIAARGRRAYRWGVAGGSAAVATLALLWTLERSLMFSLLPR